MSNNAQDQRKYPRVKVNVPVRLAGEDEMDADIEGECFSIGGGGFGFIIDRPFAEGSWLTAEIDLPDGILHARAVVVSSAPQAEDSDKWVIATRLVELPGEDRQRLTQALGES
ncbi:MAG TPA: PilZ domain-containing protein [Blastocatellia bacterium]|nr:PilZ domain-containing protein [Blastocatellia bacterium]